MNTRIIAACIIIYVLCRPAIVKIDRALDDFHSMQTKVDEAVKAVTELKGSIENFRIWR